MDNNRSSMDSQQSQLTSTEDLRQLPATTDDMAINITNNNHIYSGSTQNIYHNCKLNNLAPAPAVPTGSPNDQSSQPAEEEVNSNIEFDDCHRVILPQAMFAKFSEKKTTTMTEIVVKRRKINRARPSLKWLNSTFPIIRYWTENNTRRAVKWIKVWNLFINLLVCYYQL